MKERSSQFDEKLSKLSRNEACGLPKEAGMEKGKISEGAGRRGDLYLSSEIQDLIRDKWKEIVEPVTKCPTYEDLRQQLKRMQ